MESITSRCGDRVELHAPFPIQNLLNMKIDQAFQNHGRLHMEVIISEHYQERFLINSYQEGKIKVIDIQSSSSKQSLFCGKIETIICQKSGHVLTALVSGVSYSIELDLEKKCRSFQQTIMKYEDVAEKVAESSQARYLWHLKKEKTIGKPIIQYKETDWAFLKRLASRFNSYIYPSIIFEKPDLHLGIATGEERRMESVEILNWGLSNEYFQGTGNGMSRKDYIYLEVKHNTAWEMGDFVYYQIGEKGVRIRYTVFKRTIRYLKGELVFIDTLGAEGLLHTNTIYPEYLMGSRFQGSIKKVEAETVYVQFDFNQEEKAEYPWPWVPEIGNHAFIMPEIGSQAVILFPSRDEKDGVVVQLMRTNEDSYAYQQEERKIFSTIYDKLLGIYPEEISVQGTNTAKVSINDSNGIQMDTRKNIDIKAIEDINLKAENLSVWSPNQILLKNTRSNIELCKSFNFFAPQGVKTTSSGRSKGREVEKTTSGKSREDQNHWAASYSALGAIPNAIPGKLNHSRILDLAASGAVPKIAKGAAVLSMSEVMSGKKVEESSCPEAFSSFSNFTSKGGYFLPGEEEENV